MNTIKFRLKNPAGEGALAHRWPPTVRAPRPSASTDTWRPPGGIPTARHRFQKGPASKEFLTHAIAVSQTLAVSGADFPDNASDLGKNVIAHDRVLYHGHAVAAKTQFQAEAALEIGGGFDGKTTIYLEPLAVKMSQISGPLREDDHEPRGRVPRHRADVDHLVQGQGRRQEGRHVHGRLGLAYGAGTCEDIIAQCRQHAALTWDLDEEQVDWVDG